MAKKREASYSEMSGKWYSWESPIGLSIFFLTLVTIAAIIKFVFFS